MGGLFRTVSNKINEGQRIQSSNHKALHGLSHMPTNKSSPSPNCWRFVYRLLILSVRRFLASRGTGKNMRSDNRTNFVGASTELKQIIKALDQAYIE